MPDLGLFGWIVVGLLAGALSGAVVGGRTARGCLPNIVVGIVGGVVGGWLAEQLGFGPTNGLIAAIVVATSAEARPLRGWEQGAALLDWGFALPSGTSVGKLVTPEEVATATKAAAATPEGTGAGTGPAVQATHPGGPTGFTVLAAASVAVVLTALPPLLLLTRRRQRRLQKPG